MKQKICFSGINLNALMRRWELFTNDVILLEEICNEHEIFKVETSKGPVAWYTQEQVELQVKVQEYTEKTQGYHSGTVQGVSLE